MSAEGVRIRFRTRDYRHVTARDVEHEAEAERVRSEQDRQSDAEREAARQEHDREWLVYDAIHGGAWYEDDDPHKVKP